jgi:5-methylcytosine-specific restriction protein A
MENGERYVETHHILPLGEDGPDTPQNVIAPCADDHRAAHFAQNRVELADRMRAILAERVVRPSSAA